MDWRGRSRRWTVVALLGMVILLVECIAWATCTTGWVAPLDDDSHEGLSWDNGMGGRVAFDGEWATTDYNGDEHEFDDYPFSGLVPAGAVITGFDVRIRGYGDGGGSLQVALSWDGGGQLDKAAGISPWIVTLPAGSSGDATWNYVTIGNPPFIHTFTQGEVCGGNDAFTVWIKATVGGTAVYVDAVEVRVTYYDETISPFTPNNPTASSSSHATSTWYNASTLPDPMVTIDWTSATDRPACGSGIDGYRAYWDTSASTNLGASDGYFFNEDGSHTQDFSQGSGSYWFHIRSIDNAGNLADATVHLGPFLYDDTWPTNPNVTSSDPTWTWMDVNAISIDATGASDSPSGVDGFAMAWDHSATWTPDNVKDREETWGHELFALEQGIWYFHLSTVDNAGNWTPVYETEGPFYIDRGNPLNPTLSSPSHAEGSLSNNPHVQIIALGATDPAQGEPGYEASSGVDGFSVLWDHSPTGEPSIPLPTKDHEETWTGMTTTLADGTWYFHIRTVDYAGNWAWSDEYGPVTLDTDAPGLFSVSYSIPQLTDSHVGTATFRVHLEFDEDMDMSLAPTMTFTPTIPAAATLVLQGSSGWTDSTSYEAVYSVADGNVEAGSVTVDVTNARDLAGNYKGSYTPWAEFSIDTLNPTVASVAADTSSVYDGDLSQQITVTWSEAMNPSAEPTVAFSAGTWTPGAAGVWSSGNTIWTRTYSVTDANVAVANVTVDVSGAQDAVGNAQQDYASQAEFSIDTQNPTVAITANDVAIYDVDVGADRFVVTATFSEAMNPAVLPSLVFLPGMATTFTNPGAAWGSGNTVYTWTYDVTDDGATVLDVDLMVSGAVDVAGNTQVLAVRADYIDVDLRNPTVTSVTADTSPVYDGDLTQQVTVTWSEAMNPSAAPAVVFGSGTWTLGAAETWSAGNTVWTRTFTVTDANTTVANVTVDVTGAQDAVGNAQQDYTPQPEFSIDTQNPSVAIAANNLAIYDGDVGVGRFTIAATFPEAMNPAVAPTLTLTPDPVTTFTNRSGLWSDGDTVYTWTCDVADAGVTVADVDVSVFGGQDVAGNVQVANTNTNYVDIDTQNPTVTSVTVSDTLVADADAGQTRYVTANFSEAMAPGTTPVFTFAPDVTTTLTHTGGLWQTTTRYRASYLAADAGVDVDSVTVDVTGTTDVAGNVQQDYAPQSEFAIDTLNPTVLGIALSDHLITDADVGGTFTVTIDYSEPMQPAVAPTVVFDPALDTTLSLLPTSAWSDGDTYVARYTVLDGNVTVDDDDVDVSSARDLAGNVQMPSSLDNDLDVDTENPIIGEFAVTGGQVGTKDGNDCVREVTFAATVTDPNGCMNPADITITSAAVRTGNASITAPYAVTRTSTDPQTAVIAGTVDVYDLTGCPAVPEVVLDAADCVGNRAVQASAEGQVYDAIVPTIEEFAFRTDGTYAVPTTEYEVNACCVTTVYFSATVRDNCCISAGNVAVEVALPTANAVLENVSWDAVQVGQKRADVTGHADVRCLTSCYARVQVRLTARDCCGNEAAPVTSATAEGLVWDRLPPEPRDDPNGYESARCDGLEVRRDDFGQYRLMIRENTPTYIDALCNDTDNCSACSCCGTLWLYDIIDAPEFGTATIVDDEGDCHGGTSFRFAPDRGYLGPDRFTYRIVDACGNVSGKVTVYTETMREVDFEDVFAVACSGGTTRIAVAATDLWIDPESPDVVPFGFTVLYGPLRGVIVVDASSVRYTPPSTATDPVYGLVPTLTFMESASIDVLYTPASGFTGRDAMRVLFSDPYGGRTVGNIDISVVACQDGSGSGAGLEVERGSPIYLVMPVTFAGVVENLWESVLLVSLADGMPVVGVVGAVWNEGLARYVVTLDTAPLAVGAYRFQAPLGNGDLVSLVVSVGEGE